jgi:hypothetical protein
LTYLILIRALAHYHLWCSIIWPRRSCNFECLSYCCIPQPW